jgi:hypothetical protein
MTMSKWLFLLFTLCATSAIAGQRINQEVYVYKYPDWAFAGGSMAGAYNSADPYQRIFCRFWLMNHGQSGEAYQVSCEATDAVGTSGYCRLYWAEAGVVNLLRSITDTSLVEFSWNPSTGLCEDISVIQNSMQIPRLSSSTATLDAKGVIVSREEADARHKQRTLKRR